MSEQEYRETIETTQREYQAKLWKLESSRDCWKFTAIAIFLLALVWIMDLLDFFSNSN